MRRSARCLFYALCLSLLCIHSQAQLPAPSADSSTAAAPKPTTILAQMKSSLSAAEAAHPGDTLQVLNAIDAFLRVQVDSQELDEQTLPLAMRELVIAEKLSGKESKAYVTAQATLASIYVAMSRETEARPLAEQAFTVSTKLFPDATDSIYVAAQLANACNALGDYGCAQHADDVALAIEDKLGPASDWDRANTLSDYSDLKERQDDLPAAGTAILKSLELAVRIHPDDYHIGIIENNAGFFYIRTGDFKNAILHLNRSLDNIIRSFGASSSLALSLRGNLADLYSRTGQFPQAWQQFELSIANKSETLNTQAHGFAEYARSLAAGGDLKKAIEESLLAARMGRETFSLQAQTLPERQALISDRQRPRGLDTALSVLASHPELPMDAIYQEMIRTRALVAYEMARRQKNLNTSNDPEVARLLKELNKARADLLTTEEANADKPGFDQQVSDATMRMESIERDLATRSVLMRNAAREHAVLLEDLRRGLPAHSALVSYVAFLRRPVEKVDPARTNTPSIIAFVLRSDSDKIQLFDLGQLKPISDIVSRMRVSVDSESRSGGQGSLRNERLYREAGEQLRKAVWDPLKTSLDNTKLVLVVPDGVLNLVPFAALPEGDGYMVEHSPVIHLLTSERDLVSDESNQTKKGLLVLGGPAFGDPAAIATNTAPPAVLRGDTISCDDFRKMNFPQLPGATAEAQDLSTEWKKWNNQESLSLLTGADATRDRFVAESGHNRILHVATHAFILNRTCGNGNPLLHSGLVFAGANSDRQNSILTAQQIASLDLNGVDWAVLSACNTGGGILDDGEGVLGLERSFREAGARSVVMSLWPVDDSVTRQFMVQLYQHRFEQHASTADAAWSASRSLLHNLRASHQSTHPWYWAGFVAAGDWR